MGLFSRDGRDRNHDGYVSPFDADETQAYVDPSRSLNREGSQTDRAQSQEPPRQAAQDSETRVDRPQPGQPRSGQDARSKRSPNAAASPDAAATVPRP